MRAVWYDRQGPASEVLELGELPEPQLGPGEVSVAVTFSGISPGDTKKRRGWLGSVMDHRRVIPHSDGAGVIRSVGSGVDPARVGQRVWIWGAQSYRPHGTAAELVAVPADQAVPLPDGVSDEVGAALGIPGITAHRAVFADGPVAGRVVMVQGALGAVGSLAAQLAVRAGAEVIATVRRAEDLSSLPESLRAHAVALDDPDPAARILDVAPRGVDRIVEVSFSANVALDERVVGEGAVIAAYATHDDPARLPFWSLLFKNTVIRLLGSDDFPRSARHEAAAELSAAAAAGDLTIDIGPTFAMADAAAAHDQVDRDNRRRTLLRIDS